jgi:integration host factor subunit beta
MLKSELHDRLAERFPQLTEKDVFEAVGRLLDALQTALADGGRIEIRGFGSFSVSRVPARWGRNPKTGETVLVPTKYRPHFKPGKALRERVERYAQTTEAGVTRVEPDDIAHARRAWFAVFADLPD